MTDRVAYPRSRRQRLSLRAQSSVSDRGAAVESEERRKKAVEQEETCLRADTHRQAERKMGRLFIRNSGKPE
jgi:hypothetical protein